MSSSSLEKFIRTFPVSGAILAGGRSSRMGRDKAFLPFPPPDGPPLLARQASLLRGLGITDLILSGRAGTDYARIPPDARVVTDPVADAGPLAGLAAVLAAARHPWVLVLAVDLPCMSAAYLQNLLRCGNGLAGVVPHGPHGYEPLAALYPQNILPRVENALAERRWGLQGLLQGLIQDATIKSLEISQADLPLFANWNTPEDTVGNLH